MSNVHSVENSNESGQELSGQTVRVFGTANDSIVDGPGIRFTIFTQGCVHDCEGCHNPESHDPTGGEEIEVDAIWKKIAANPLLDGITLSGGEPLLQPEPLLQLADRAHQAGLNVWTYTGYLYEDVLEGVAGEKAKELLLASDVVVDGPFEQDKMSLDLKFRGSSNQRIITVA